jgi:hypothetical protein
MTNKIGIVACSDSLLVFSVFVFFFSQEATYINHHCPRLEMTEQEKKGPQDVDDVDDNYNGKGVSFSAVTFSELPPYLVTKPISESKAISAHDMSARTMENIRMRPFVPVSLSTQSEVEDHTTGGENNNHHNPKTRDENRLKKSLSVMSSSPTTLILSLPKTTYPCDIYAYSSNMQFRFILTWQAVGRYVFETVESMTSLEVHASSLPDLSSWMGKPFSKLSMFDSVVNSFEHEPMCKPAMPATEWRFMATRLPLISCSREWSAALSSPEIKLIQS